MNNSIQLTLDMFLDVQATFDNFYAGNNAEGINYLQKFSQPPPKDVSLEKFVYLWGVNGSGFTHLLQACCNEALTKGYSVIYIPLKEWRSLTIKILENITHVDLICLDDLQNIAGQIYWETAIMQTINAVLAQNRKLLITANHVATNLPLLLPDLQSRLQGGLTFHLQSLTDEQKIAAMQMRMQAKGLYLADNVAKFLLGRFSREPKRLFATLDVLDKASLVANRKLTIKFIKEVLEI